MKELNSMNCLVMWEKTKRPYLDLETHVTDFSFFLIKFKSYVLVISALLQSWFLLAASFPENHTWLTKSDLK